MKQFYETYRDKPELSKLLRENTWSNNLHIISKTKSYEEKEFYLKLASKEKYKAKELARQIDSGYYERLLLSNGKAPSAIESKDMTGVLRDMYMLEFLDLPEPYKEYDLKKAILKNMGCKKINGCLFESDILSNIDKMDYLDYLGKIDERSND